MYIELSKANIVIIMTSIADINTMHLSICILLIHQ